MANFYTEIPELKYHLNNPMMKRICELKERNYRDKDEFDYAPLCRFPRHSLLKRLGYLLKSRTKIEIWEKNKK